MKKFVLAKIFLFISCFAFAQNTKDAAIEEISIEPVKKTVSLVGLNFYRDKNIEVLNKLPQIEVSGKYFQIKLDSSIVRAALIDSYFSDDEIRKEKEFIKLFNQNKIGQQIVSNWFNLQPDSSFNLEVLQNRASVKITKDELLKAAESKKNRLKLMEMGIQFVNQSYVLVFDYENTRTMEEYYREIGTDKKYQYLNGYISTVNCHLLKFDFNRSVASTFLKELWINPSDTNKLEKTLRFANAEFPFVFVKSYTYEISSVQHNPGHPFAPKVQKSENVLLRELTELAMENVLSDFNSAFEPFKLRLMIKEANPVSAKIGKRGGLKFDQSYFVFENRLKKNGNIKQKKIGVVKSNRIIDNRNDSVPQITNSAFYQIAGGPIYRGMYLKKRNDLGLNVSLGKSFSGLESYNARVEYYFSKMFTDAIVPGKTVKGSTSFKLYLSAAYHQKLYNIDDHIWNNTFVRGSVGVSKDFYPVRFLHWGPYLGYGLESVTREGTPNVVSSNFAEIGLRAGVNVRYNIQLIASYNYYKFFKSVEMDANKDVVNPDFDYNGIYPDRDKNGISLGIRFML